MLAHIATALGSQAADVADPVRQSWRDHLPIHPAAELFPLMSEAELKELAEDIKNHGLRIPIIIWETDDKKDTALPALLDGRNRLDALALLGLLCVDSDGELCTNKCWNGYEWIHDGGEHYLSARRTADDDPYAVALSFNVHRRHLATEQKRELIAKVLKAKPEASNLQIAKQVKVDDKTVAKVRTDLETRSEIPNVKARTDTKGRKQPAGKLKKGRTQTIDMVRTGGADGVNVWSAPHQPEVSIEQRRTEMAALADVADPRASHKATGEAHVQEKEAADKPEHKAPSVKDTALSEFNDHVLRLLQITSKAKPKRFAKTSVSASDLSRLGRFLAAVHED